MSRMGIGIVGYGKVASGTHKRWIDARDDAELVAVYDAVEARREAAATEAPDARVYSSYTDLLDDADVALIVITTPPNSHRDLAVAASRAGKHVFVDKPFAMTLTEAEEMIAAAKSSGRVVHCHQSRRYDGEYARIVDLVSAGRIGSVQHVRRIWSQYGEGWTSWGIEGFNPTWRIQREFGGGMVYDYAPHCGDQILRLIDRPLESVCADVRGLKFSQEVDDHFACMMRFEGGATAYLEASNMAQLSAPHWYVMGTEGCITADAVNGAVLLKREDIDQPEQYDPVDRSHELYDNLMASCRGEAEPNVTPGQIRASMGLIDALFASAKRGRSVVPERPR